MILTNFFYKSALSVFLMNKTKDEKTYGRNI